MVVLALGAALAFASLAKTPGQSIRKTAIAIMRIHKYDLLEYIVFPSSLTLRMCAVFVLVCL
jgi:hypothetical protein